MHSWLMPWPAQLIAAFHRYFDGWCSEQHVYMLGHRRMLSWWGCLGCLTNVINRRHYSSTHDPPSSGLAAGGQGYGDAGNLVPSS